MTQFQYSGLDDSGKTVTGLVEAAGRAEGIAKLTERRVFVTEIDVSKSQDKSRPAVKHRFVLHRNRISKRMHVAMLRQLTTALQAGLPLLSAIEVVQQQTDNRALHELMTDLANRVRAGESLSEAMAENPKRFSTLEISMVRVGETAGLLDQVMGYLSQFAEFDLDMRESIRSAAMYPIFVLLLALVSVVVIITVILPRVMGTVVGEMSTGAMPGPTRILLSLSEFLQSYGWAVGLLAVAGVIGFRAWLRRPGGRLAFDRFKLKIPVLGTALRQIAVARFARTLGTLSKAGISILEALRVLRDTLGNEALAQSIDKVTAGITQGQSIADPLRSTGEFPPLLIQVIAMGEKTGKLDDLLLQTATAYEKDTSAAIGRVMTILPALFIVLLALVVVFVLAAVLLPIIDMETMMPGM